MSDLDMRNDAGDSGKTWTESRFRIAVAVGAVLLFALIFRLRFCYELTVPPRPPPPKTTITQAKQLTVDLDRDPNAYAAHLQTDARGFGIDAPTVDDMSRVFPYRVDDTPHVLTSAIEGESVEAAGLRLSLVVRKIKGTPKEQMILQIENTTTTPLAYQVHTRPSVGSQPCHAKSDLPHNAIAIGPGDLEMRSECLFREGWTLEITKVETIELPELAYLYASQLSPPQIGVEARVARGHKPPRGSACQLVLPAPILRAIERGQTSWRDMVDFYARHSCATYTFPMGYVAFQRDGERALPALEQDR